MTHVVVVGAGLLGTAVADELAGLGTDVTVVEAGRPGGGTSGSSFAWVNAQDKAPEAYFQLNVEGVRSYPHLAADLGGEWYHVGGDVAIGRGPAAAKLTEKIERHRAAGYPVRELDRAGLAALEPGLRLPAGGDLAAAHFPDEAWIDAPPLVARRLARAVERGARSVTETAVVGFDVAAGSRVTGVRTAAGSLPADVVVVAAGPATESVAASVGAVLPMAPSPGLLLTVGPLATPVSHVVHAGDVALRPDGDGRLLLSSRDVDASLDPSTRAIEPAARACRQLLDLATAILPELARAPVERARVGVRSVAADGLPVAGFAPPLENLYLLVAHSGVTLAPVLGRLVACEVTGGHEAALDAYRPARFG